MPESFHVIDATTDPTEVAGALDEVGCILARGVLADSCIREIAGFVYGEVDRHAELFRSTLGFEWGDSAKLAAFLGADPARSPAYEALSPEIKHLVRGELPLDVRISPTLKEVAHQPALIGVVRAALRDPIVRLHHPPSVRAGLPGVQPALVPLHQDASYAWHLAEFITVWVPLCRIDAACGGIGILPGSHHSPKIAHSSRAIWLETDAKVSAEDLVPIECEPGDAIIFGPYLLHASQPNRSNRVRCSIDYRFFSHRFKSPKHYYDIEERAVRFPAADEVSVP